MDHTIANSAAAVQRYFLPIAPPAWRGREYVPLRLSRDLDQAGLAARAGVSLSAVRSLEAGRGSTLHTLVRVARALGREEWFASIAPVATINPLTVLRHAKPRQRAGRRSPPTES